MSLLQLSNNGVVESNYHNLNSIKELKTKNQNTRNRLWTSKVDCHNLCLNVGNISNNIIHTYMSSLKENFFLNDKQISP